MIKLKKLFSKTTLEFIITKQQNQENKPVFPKVKK